MSRLCKHSAEAHEHLKAFLRICAEMKVSTISPRNRTLLAEEEAHVRVLIEDCLPHESLYPVPTNVGDSWPWDFYDEYRRHGDWIGEHLLKSRVKPE